MNNTDRREALKRFSYAAPALAILSLPKGAAAQYGNGGFDPPGLDDHPHGGPPGLDDKPGGLPPGQFKKLSNVEDNANVVLGRTGKLAKHAGKHAGKGAGKGAGKLAKAAKGLAKKL